MATTLVLAALSPVAGADSDEDQALNVAWRCVPSQDKTAEDFEVAGGVYYVRTYGTSAYTIQEIWQEVNTESGLQYSNSMSCLSKADRFVKSVCMGLCSITL